MLNFEKCKQMEEKYGEKAHNRLSAYSQQACCKSFGCTERATHTGETSIIHLFSYHPGLLHSENKRDNQIRLSLSSEGFSPQWATTTPSTHTFLKRFPQTWKNLSFLLFCAVSVLHWMRGRKDSNFHMSRVRGRKQSPLQLPSFFPCTCSLTAKDKFSHWGRYDNTHFSVILLVWTL